MTTTPVPTTAGLDLSTLAGDYTCAAAAPGGLSRLRAGPHNGTLRVRAFGHGETDPDSRGEVTADAVFAEAPHSRAGYAFLATFDDSRVRSRLQTYQGLGVVVVHGFHSFKDGRPRGYFTREFFVAASRIAMGPTRGASAPVAMVHAGAGDLAALSGVWTNVKTAGVRVAEVECQPHGPDPVVRVRAVDDAGGWGEAQAHLYADAANPDGPPALLAMYEHGLMRVHLQARINRGVLVVAEYTELTHGNGHSNFMIRECFYRQGGIPR